MISLILLFASIVIDGKNINETSSIARFIKRNERNISRVLLICSFVLLVVTMYLVIKAFNMRYTVNNLESKFEEYKKDYKKFSSSNGNQN